MQDKQIAKTQYSSREKNNVRGKNKQSKGNALPYLYLSMPRRPMAPCLVPAESLSLKVSKSQALAPVCAVDTDGMSYHLGTC